MNGARKLVPLGVFTPFIEQWSLLREGEAFETPSSYLLPVQCAGSPAMLKVLKSQSDEAGGIAALRFFDGEAAVEVYASAERAMVMERVPEGRSLTQMALAGDDDAAATILADTATALSRTRTTPMPELLTLTVWFGGLFRRRNQHPGLRSAAHSAKRLLANPRGLTVLHADLHHENVLESSRGWLVIDPKGVIGEPAYEYATLFLNPWEEPRLVLDPRRALRHAELYAALAGVDAPRILKWAHAHAGLSVAWCLEDGRDPSLTIEVMEMLEALTHKV